MFGPSLILPGPSRRPRPFSQVQESGVHWSKSLVAKLSPRWGRSPWDGFPCAKSSIRPQETESHQDVTKDGHKDDSNGTDIDGYVVVGSVEEALPPRSDDDLGQDWVDDFTPDVSKESPSRNNDIAAPAITIGGTSPEIDDTTAGLEAPDAISAPKDSEINGRTADHDPSYSAHREAWNRLESLWMDTMSPEGRLYETETLDAKYVPMWTSGVKWTSGTNASPSTTDRPAPAYCDYRGVPIVMPESAPLPPSVFEGTSLPDLVSDIPGQDPPASTSVVSGEDLHWTESSHPSPWLSLDTAYRVDTWFRVHDGDEPDVGKELQPPSDPTRESMKRVLASEHKEKRPTDTPSQDPYYAQNPLDKFMDHRGSPGDLLHRYSQQITRLEIAGHYVDTAKTAEISPPDQVCCDHQRRPVWEENPPWRSLLGIVKARWIRTATILGCLAKQLCDGRPLLPNSRDPLGEAYEAIVIIYHAYGIGPSPACQRKFKCQMKLTASQALESGRPSGLSPYIALKMAPVSSTKSGNSTVEQKHEDLNRLSRPPKTGKGDDAKPESAPAQSPVWKPKLASSSAALKPIREPRLPDGTSEFSVIRTGRRWRS